MSLWVDVLILFAFMWAIVGYLKEIRNDLSYLIDLLEQNPDLVNQQDNQTKEQDNQIRSRKDLYK